MAERDTISPILNNFLEFLEGFIWNKLMNSEGIGPS